MSRKVKVTQYRGRYGAYIGSVQKSGRKAWVPCPANIKTLEAAEVWLSRKLSPHSDADRELKLSCLTDWYLGVLESRATSGDVSAIHVRGTKARLHAISRLLGASRKCHTITQSVVRELEMKMQSAGNKSRTIISYIGALTGMFSEATIQDKLSVNPLAGYRKLSRRPPPIFDRNQPTPHHFYRGAWRLARMRNDKLGKVFVLCLRFQQETGCRTLEATRLRWEWYETRRKLFRFSGKTTRATGKERIIILNRRALRIIQALGPRPSGLVFNHEGVGWSTSAALNYRKRKVEKALGIKVNWKPYDLRKDRITKLLDSGISIRDTAALVGTSAAMIEATYDQKQTDRLRSLLD